MRALTALVAFILAAGAPALAASLDYPETARGTETDTRFGTTVADPYRWLENDLRQDPRVADWVRRQRAFTDGYFATLPNRKAIRDRVEKIWGFEKLGAPRKRGDRYFYERNSGLQSQNPVYVQDGATGKPRLLLDPNALSASGELIVRDWVPSNDSRVVAFTVQSHGGDQQRLRFIDVPSGRVLDDEVEGLTAGLFAWHPDGQGVFYTHFQRVKTAALTAAAAETTVRYHRIGATAPDIEIYRGPPGDRLLNIPRTSRDGRWLMIASADPGGTNNEVRVKDLSRPDSPVLPLVTGLANRWLYVGEQKGELLFVTNKAAPRDRIAALRPDAGAAQAPREVVAQGERPILRAVAAGDGLVVQYVDGLSSVLRRFSATGRPEGTVELPTAIIADQVQGQPGDPELFYLASSMVRAPTVYHYNLKTRRSAVFKAPEVSWKPDDFVLRQITATSKDGTRIPVTLAYRRDLDLSRPQPTVLMAYGGWGISPGLNFYESRFVWLDMGGVFAIAHTRGGAEFGKEWYESARRAGRLKTIDDYVAVAELLQREGITSSDKLIAYGSSNGGILVSAATNARPDLFAVTLPRVPVTDMIRYTRFTLGRMWVDELGDPDKPDDFKALMAYSPLHNIRGGRRYPAILVQTADTDDRVVPAHSFKYVASLQAADIGDRPHLIRIEANAGHGDAKPADKLMTEFTDLWTFAAAEVGLDPR